MSLVPDEIKDVLAECYRSTKVTAKTLFPDRFYLPFSQLSDKIFNILDNDNIKLAVIAAPRGWGKTSTVNLAYPAKKILFREKKFIVPISNTATQAIMQSENLKRELLTNPAVTKLFGPMKTDTFSKEQWITETGTMVLPRGSGQQVRGILFGDERPDLIIVDDLEDPESVKNEDTRKKLKEWFFADVLNSVNRGKGNWKVIVIGTLLHEASLLSDLLEDEAWHKEIIDLCDDNYHSNWPDFMSDEDIDKLVQGYRNQGLLEVFYREYRNRIKGSEFSPFTQQLFMYHDEMKLDEDQYIENVVIVDPAKSVKVHSDWSAVVGVGIDVKNHKISFRRCTAGMMHPDQIYDEAFKMCEELHSTVLAVEVTSLSEFITFPIKNEIVRRGSIIQFVELHARSEKDLRIRQLVPMYRRGMITHNRATCNVLEEQLLSFPRSKRWDVMDAFAYVLELLEIGERYFLPKLEKARDEEYQQIGEYEPPPDDIYGDEMVSRGNWRMC